MARPVRLADLSDRAVVALDAPTRLVHLALRGLADDRGRVRVTPAKLATIVFPALGQHTAKARVDDALRALITADVIRHAVLATGAPCIRFRRWDRVFRRSHRGGRRTARGGPTTRAGA